MNNKNNGTLTSTRNNTPYNTLNNTLNNTAKEKKMAEEKNFVPRWYTVQTYSKRENRVKIAIEKAAENRGFQDRILKVVVPVVEEKEERRGKIVTVQHTKYPGYVFVYMIVTPETWYLVRNIAGSYGLIGVGSEPVPLSDEDVESIFNITNPCEYEIGEKVIIATGAMEGQDCTITAIDSEKSSISGTTHVLGKEISVELRFDQIRKI